MSDSFTTCLLRVNLKMLWSCLTSSTNVKFSFGGGDTISVVDHREEVAQAAHSWVMAYLNGNPEHESRFIQLQQAFNGVAQVKLVFHGVFYGRSTFSFHIWPGTSQTPNGVFVVDFTDPSALISATGPSATIGNCWARFMPLKKQYQIFAGIVTPETPAYLTNSMAFDPDMDRQASRLGLHI